MLEVEGLKKRYGKVLAVDGVSLRVALEKPWGC
jgi:hypothetical protein